MVVLPSPKYIQPNNFFWTWGDDRWIDPWTQWNYCELDLDQDYINPTDLHSPRYTIMILLSVSICVNLDIVSYFLRVFLYTLFPSVQLSRERTVGPFEEGLEVFAVYTCSGVAKTSSWGSRPSSGHQFLDLENSQGLETYQEIITFCQGSCAPSISWSAFLEIFRWYSLSNILTGHPSVPPLGMLCSINRLQLSLQGPSELTTHYDPCVHFASGSEALPLDPYLSTYIAISEPTSGTAPGPQALSLSSSPSPMHS